jgi:hypothetical protein
MKVVAYCQKIANLMNLHVVSAFLSHASNAFPRRSA